MTESSSKQPSTVRAVRILSWLFFVPFVPYVALSIWTNNSIGGLIMLVLWPVSVYLAVVGIIYIVALVEFLFSHHSTKSQKLISSLIVLGLATLAIWLYGPVVFDL